MSLPSVLRLARLLALTTANSPSLIGADSCGAHARAGRSSGNRGERGSVSVSHRNRSIVLDILDDFPASIIRPPCRPFSHSSMRFRDMVRSGSASDGDGGPFAQKGGFFNFGGSMKRRKREKRTKGNVELTHSRLPLTEKSARLRMRDNPGLRESFLPTRHGRTRTGWRPLFSWAL